MEVIAYDFSGAHRPVSYTHLDVYKRQAPGSSNGNGAVYDPVFGWVVPGDVQQSTGDSDGDLNKQV